MHWSGLITPFLLNAFLGAAADEASSVFTQASNDSLLWGPYRPGLYFGLRPRIPESLTASLLWGRGEDYYNMADTMRFTCEQHSGMDGYGWDIYDPRTGGVQTIRDKENGLDLETSFVKFDGGRGWGARIRGRVRDDAEPSVGSQNGVKDNLKSSVVLTLGLEGESSQSQVVGAEAGSELGFDGDVEIAGQTGGYIAFKVSVTEPRDRTSHPVLQHPSYALKPLDRTLVHSVEVPQEALWQGKALVFSSMRTTIDEYVEKYTEEKMPAPWQTYTIQNRPGAGNVHMIQKVFEGDFEFDVYFVPYTASRPTYEEMTNAIKDVVQGFDAKYQSALAAQSPFQDKKYLPFSKSLFSNLIGGLGYFHGDHLVDRSYASEYDEENEAFHIEAAEARALGLQKLEGPYTLFASTPSRPFFPRGFLWDEGFHLLPIIDFDPEVVMQVVSSWFENMMDEDGWIPREVILGWEARAKVPEEFQVQYPHYANPPTLFMVLEALLEKFGDTEKKGQDSSSPAKVDAEMLKTWLRQLYPLLQRNYAWYRKTQYGELKSYDRGEISNSREGYRWRGRTPTHVLTSGLDDYPRAQPPHPGELHTDLISWMGMMTRSLQRVAAYLGEKEDFDRYSKVLKAIKQNTEDLHWDKGNKTYCDVTVDDFEESVHVCHKGYISIAPFLTGLIGPQHEHLGAVLDLISDENELWSPFGIRSLSKRDALYETGENYWRSPVWMNINYLILENLMRIGEQQGPHQAKASKMYTTLRKNLVYTVYRSWEKTGFAWEQYNPQTGEGQRTQHFTGWTSLVVKIMSMPEAPEKGRVRDRHDEL